jgi:hypothetical protein
MTKTVIVVIGEKKDFNALYKLFSPERDKIILLGILPREEKDHKKWWSDLFLAQEMFRNEGFRTAVSTEKGTLFVLPTLQEQINADAVAIPKTAFLNLASDEYEDFLEMTRCILIIY